MVVDLGLGLLGLSVDLIIEYLMFDLVCCIVRRLFVLSFLGLILLVWQFMCLLFVWSLVCWFEFGLWF